MIENNRTVEYLKQVKKYRPVTLPKDKTKQPSNSRPDINLLIYSNYEEYRDEVCKTANRKRNVVFEDEDTVSNMCVNARSRSPYPWSNVMVHGARNGKFTHWIFQTLGVDVDATELSPAVSKMQKRSMEWDFHNIKPEWQEKYDMVWSSSFFHSYDPYLCIQQWMKCVKRGPTGCAVLLHHAPGSDAKRVERDIPFGANLDETILLINAAGRDKRNGGRNFHVETVWNKSDGVSWERSKYKRYIVVVPTR